MTVLQENLTKRRGFSYNNREDGSNKKKYLDFLELANAELVITVLGYSMKSQFQTPLYEMAGVHSSLGFFAHIIVYQCTYDLRHYSSP